MARLGVNKEYLKKRNRGLVLQLIATGKCSSRIELAKELQEISYYAKKEACPKADLLKFASISPGS